MIILGLHLLTTAFLTGLIWTIQLAHYPSFRFIDENQFTGFHQFHVKRITMLVAPMMLLEGATAAFLLFVQSPIATIFIWTNLCLLAATWLITGLWSVPCHGQLEKGYERQAHRSLLQSNSWRTALWSARTAMLFFAFTSSFQKGELL